MNQKEIIPDLVDIVILSWNRVESTIQTIENILSQTIKAKQIWVIDQGSSDECIHTLQTFITANSQIKMIQLGKNYGVAGGRNRGMKLGNGEFIICIDNDAIFEDPDGIKKTVEKFHSDHDLAIIGYRIKNYSTNIADRANWVYARQLHPKNNEEFFTTRFCGAGHAIRRSDLEKTEFYDETLFFYWEELDLSYQMINQNKKIIFYSDVNILHKVDPEQRFDWESSRYFYLVRNAIYLDWKYYRNIFRVVFLSGGYLLKGLFNHLAVQTILGIINAFPMMKKCNNPSFKLTVAAKQYIHENDTVYRGNLISRIKFEILEKLK
jgi:GT2 family glycosyltransferase